MDSVRIGQIALAIVVTYAIHSTLLLVFAWLLDRSRCIKSFAAIEHVWKSAVLAPLLTTALQYAWMDSSSVWEFTIGGEAYESEISQIIGFTAPPPSISDVTDSSIDGDIQNATNQPVMKTEVDVRGVEQSSIVSAHRSDFDEQWTVEINPGHKSPNPRRPAIEKLELPQTHIHEHAVRHEVAAEFGQLPSTNSGALATKSAYFESPPETAINKAPWCSIVVLLLTACTVFGLIRLVVQKVCTHLFLRSCRRVTGGDAFELLQQLRSQRRIRSRVDLLVTGRVVEPSACGVFRWTIILPDGLETKLNRTELRALLSHELGHLVRWDPFWLLIGRVLTACLPWQPLNSLAVKRWQQAAEFQCDEWAIDGDAEPVTLAHVLTTVAQGKIDGVLSPGLPASAPPLSQRVERLLDSSSSKDRWGCGWRRWSLLSISLAVIAATSAFGPRVLWAVTQDAIPSSTELPLPPSSPEFPGESKNDDVELQMELQSLVEDLERAMELLREQEDDERVYQKTTAIIRRLQRLQVSAEELSESP